MSPYTLRGAPAQVLRIVKSTLWKQFFLKEGSIRNPTHTDQYLLWTSEHPTERNTQVICMLNERATTIASTDSIQRPLKKEFIRLKLRQLSVHPKDMIETDSKVQRHLQFPVRVTQKIIIFGKQDLVLPPKALKCEIMDRCRRDHQTMA